MRRVVVVGFFLKTILWKDESLWPWLCFLESFQLELRTSQLRAYQCLHQLYFNHWPTLQVWPWSYSGLSLWVTQHWCTGCWTKTSQSLHIILPFTATAQITSWKKSYLENELVRKRHNITIKRCKYGTVLVLKTEKEGTSAIFQKLNVIYSESHFLAQLFHHWFKTGPITDSHTTRLVSLHVQIFKSTVIKSWLVKPVSSS